ncbi:MAG: transcription antitermination factor NusB [Desulfobulbales bacterium]
MGLRRKSREIALQFLFGLDLKKSSFDPKTVEKELDRFCGCFETSKKALPYACKLIEGICAYREDIDKQLISHSYNWRLERMSPVDRNILRIAVFEIKHSTEVPPKVAINEALEIAKHYSLPDSVAFINGILDAMHGEET